MDIIWMLRVFKEAGLYIPKAKAIQARKRASVLGKWKNLKEAMNDQLYWRMMAQLAQKEVISE